MSGSTIQYYQCRGYNKKCTVRLDDSNHKTGKLPGFCSSCKAEKLADDAKLRQKKFRFRQTTIGEIKSK